MARGWKEQHHVLALSVKSVLCKVGFFWGDRFSRFGGFRALTCAPYTRSELTENAGVVRWCDTGEKLGYGAFRVCDLRGVALEVRVV